MKLQRRHYRVIEFLEANPKKRYGVDELARTLKLSLSVLRNELPHLVQAGYIQRKPDGRTFDYLAAKQANNPQPTAVKATPLHKKTLEEILINAFQRDYEPKLNKLGWNLPKALVELCQVALTGDGSQAACRKALLDLLEATERYGMVLRSILATPQLWDDRLSAWLTEGLSEENLEKLQELTRQGYDAHGRLSLQEQGTETTT